MVAEITLVAVQLLLKGQPFWWFARVQCCSRGCERYAFGLTEAAVAEWATLTEKLEYAHHQCKQM